MVDATSDRVRPSDRMAGNTVLPIGNGVLGANYLYSAEG